MRKIAFIALSLLHVVICISSGMFGYQMQFLVMGLSHLTLGTFLLRKNPFRNRSMGLLIIFLPLTLLYFGSCIYCLLYNNFRLIPFVVVMTITTIFSLTMYRLPIKTIIIPYFGVGLLLSISSYYLLNYYLFIASEPSEVVMNRQHFDDYNLPMYDEIGNFIPSSSFKGRVCVIEVWNSRCASCIKGFPRYEKLRVQYAKDGVDFFTLNVKVQNEDSIRVRQFTRQYGFQKLYCGQEGFRKLGINAVPYTIILNKDSQIVFVGQINTNENVIYQNFHSIIKKII